MGEITADAVFRTTYRGSGVPWAERAITSAPSLTDTTRMKPRKYALFVNLESNRQGRVGPLLTIVGFAGGVEKLFTLREFLQEISEGRDSAPEEEVVALEKALLSMNRGEWSGALEGEIAEDTEVRAKAFLETISLLKFVRGFS